MRANTPRILTSVAAIVLIATAAFHATGYRALAGSPGLSAMSPFFRKSLPGIWLFFSWHLTALALGLVWASVGGGRSARPLVTFIALMVCVDTLFVFSLAGVFAGTVLLAVAASCAVIASIRWPVA